MRGSLFKFTLNGVGEQTYRYLQGDKVEKRLVYDKDARGRLKELRDLKNLYLDPDTLEKRDPRLTIVHVRRVLADAFHNERVGVDVAHGSRHALATFDSRTCGDE